MTDAEKATERFRQAIESGYYHRERFPGDREVIMNPAYKTDMYRGKPDKKKFKLRGLDLYVIFSISLLLVYTIAEFVTATITGVEKSTLTLAFFGFFGAPELLGCALIKIFKLKKKGDGNEED